MCPFGIDALEYSHAAYIPCFDITTGEEMEVKGHSLRIIDGMEALAIVSQEGYDK